MADAEHKDDKKDAGHGATASIVSKETVDTIIYSCLVLLVIGAAIYIALVNPETAATFVYFLNGLQVLLVLYIGYLIWKLRQFIHKFEHHVHGLMEIFKSKYRPPAKRGRALTQLENRFERSKGHIGSQYREEWKIGIIELDTILKDLLVQRGYSGDTVGELLKSAGEKGMSSVNLAWEAHKIRNQVVHEGIKFEMSQDLALQALRKYTTAFNELGISPVEVLKEEPKEEKPSGHH